MNEKQPGKSQLQSVIFAILNRLIDKDVVVTNAAITSLRRLSKNHTTHVIFECCAFCKECKPSKDHLKQILSIIEYVTQEYIVNIDGDGVIMLVDFCLSQIMEQAEVTIQKNASEILVAIGKQHPVQIVEVLAKNLEDSCKEMSENSTGTVHSVILYTLGSLAAVNPCAVVPHMKQMFSLLLPLMGISKNEVHIAIAYVMGRFGEALQEYSLNGKNVPDPTLNSESFQMELNFVCDSLINGLQNSRDPKEVLLALTSLLPVINADKVTQHIQNLLPIVLNMCKKQKELLASVQCLSAIVLVSSETNGTILEPFLNSIITILSDLIQPEQDYAQPYFIRVHAEALRCYERLSKHFTDFCVDYLLKLLKSPTNDKNRLKSLLIFNHLINSTDGLVKNKMGNFLQILSDLLDNSSVTVKKVLLRTVVALSCKDLLPKDVQSNYCRFILHLCDNFKQEKSEIANHEANSLREAAENTLYMLSTTVPELSDALCNVLLQNILQGKQNGIYFRCLASLSSAKPEFWQNPNVNVFVCCLVVLGKPIPLTRTINVIKFLQNIRPCQQDSYRVTWDEELLKMLQFLKDHPQQTLSESEWLDLIINFLSKILESVQNEEFTNSVIYTIRTEIEKSQQEDSDLLLKLLAVTTCHLKNTNQVIPSIKCVLKTARSYEVTRLDACAKALGIMSKIHMKLILDELMLLRKEFLTRGQGSKLMGIFGGNPKNDVTTEKVRILLLKAYSEICGNSVPLLFQTIEKDVLDFAVEELNNCKDMTVRSCCLGAIKSVAEAMHPARNSLHVAMRDRTEVMRIVSGQLQLHSGPEFVQLFPLTIPVLTALVRLPPALESDDRVQLVSHCITTVLNAAAVYCKISEDGKKYGDLKLSSFVHNSLSLLSQLVCEIIIQSPDHFALDEVVLILEPWLGRKKPEQRLPALETLDKALATYLEHCQFAYGAPGGFGQCGALVAHLVPRTSDSNRNIRVVAVRCIRSALCIAARHDGNDKEYDKVIEQKLKKSLEGITTEEPRALSNLTMDIAHAVVSHVPRVQLPQLMNGLIDSLVDIELTSCYNSSLVLSTAFKVKSADVPEHVTQIFDKLLSVLNKIECPRTRTTSLKSILALALNYPKVIINNLLSKPLPYQPVICDCWAVLSTDETIVTIILDYFKKIFHTSAPYEEKLTANDMNVVTLQPLQAICALNEICKNSGQLRSICKQQFPELFCRLLVTIASYAEAIIPAFAGGSQTPAKEIYVLKPADLCIMTTRQLLSCCGYETVSVTLQDTGKIENLGHVLQMLPKIAEEICSMAPELMSWLVSSLAPFTRSEWIPWRACSIKFLSHLLEFSSDVSSILAENVVEILLGAQSDTSHHVRQSSFYGLGVAMEKLPWETTSRYCDGIVDAFLRTLEYYNGKEELSVVLEALLSFSKLLRTLEENRQEFGSFHVTAAVRIKPLFEQDNDELRAAAFCLLGDLAGPTMKEKHLEAFKEQIFADLVPLMLHLVDESEKVIQSCKYTLHRISPMMHTSKISETIKNKVVLEGTMNFSDFANEFVKVLGQEYQDLLPVLLQTCASYWKSSYVMLRAHAALLARIIIQEFNEESLKAAPVETLSIRLLNLCDDGDPYVRAQAIKTITSFFLK